MSEHQRLLSLALSQDARPAALTGHMGAEREREKKEKEERGLRIATELVGHCCFATFKLHGIDLHGLLGPDRGVSKVSMTVH